MGSLATHVNISMPTRRREEAQIDFVSSPAASTNHKLLVAHEPKPNRTSGAFSRHHRNISTSLALTSNHHTHPQINLIYQHKPINKNASPVPRPSSSAPTPHGSPSTTTRCTTAAAANPSGIDCCPPTSTAAATCSTPSATSSRIPRPGPIRTDGQHSSVSLAPSPHPHLHPTH